MQKIILVAILLCAFGRLKAQQVTSSLAPLNRSSYNLFDTYRKADTNHLLNSLGLSLSDIPKGKITGITNDPNAIIIYSKMPVADVTSNDCMPVTKPGQAGMKYTMQVKRVIINPPALIPVP